MIIVTGYPATTYVVIYPVSVRKLKFYLIPFPKREFLSITLQNYEWPGNVRELENIVEYAVTMEGEETITHEYLPSDMKEVKSAAPSLKINSGKAERKLIEDLLNQYGWDVKGKKKAAKQLQIDLRTLYRKIKKFGIGGV